jgi:hypothetical protein
MATSTELRHGVQFVLYEVWMLRECAHLPRPADRVLRNLWYEGLALHGRVLRDFLFTKVHTGKHKGERATRPDDIVAVDYFSAPSSWPFTSNDLPQYLEKNKQRMDRALAHLSYDRIKYESEDKDWSARDLLSEIGEKWFDFIARLEQNKEPTAHWFRDHRRARLVPLSPPF